jgi:hypothetical protein
MGEVLADLTDVLPAVAPEMVGESTRGFELRFLFWLLEN